MPAKTWFITGTSRGFGREWAIAALDRGDQVAATARDTGTLRDLVDQYGDAILPLPLDVTDRAAGFAAVRAAHDRFGRLDVVVNNAGYGHFGLVEEITEAEARAQFEANFFGALWITQAALPRSCAPRAAATSCRCPRSAASPPSRTSGSTTRPSGRWRASARRSPPRSPPSASGSRSSSPAPTPPTGPARRRHSAPLDDYAAVREGPPGSAPPARPPRRPGRHPLRDPPGRRRRRPAAAHVPRPCPARHRHQRLRVPPGHLARLAAGRRAGPGRRLARRMNRYPDQDIRVALMSVLSTLPTLDRGRSAQTSTCLGALTLPMPLLDEGASARPGRAAPPACSCTTAMTRSPHFSSGRPMTAQSWTRGAPSAPARPRWSRR